MMFCRMWSLLVAMINDYCDLLQTGDQLFIGAVGSWYWQGKLH